MIGAAWGGAWGHCGWGHNDININVNNNFNRNNINRNTSGNRGGGNNWQHNSQHRGGSALRRQGHREQVRRRRPAATRSRAARRARGSSRRAAGSELREPCQRGAAPAAAAATAERARARTPGAAVAAATGSGAATSAAAARVRARAPAPGAAASAARAATAAAARGPAAHAEPRATEAAAGAAEVAAAAAEGGGEVRTMKSRTAFPLLAGLLGALLLPAPLARGESPAPAQKTFPSAQAAADALVSAAERFDVEALKAILGPDGIDLVVTEDAVQDRNQAAEFAAQAREKLVVVTDPKNPKTATIIVGPGDWPMPIPIVKDGSAWRFDTVAGRREILLRRIGRNELDAIEVCRGFVEAQHEYASQRRDGARVNQYAQKIVSTPGQQDGLAWQNPDGTWGGPVAEKIARAIAEGYRGQVRAVPRLLLQGPQGAGPDGAARRARLRRPGRDDRRLRPRRGAGGLREDRREDVHRRATTASSRRRTSARRRSRPSGRWSASTRTRAGARSGGGLRRSVRTSSRPRRRSGCPRCRWPSSPRAPSACRSAAASARRRSRCATSSSSRPRTRRGRTRQKVVRPQRSGSTALLRLPIHQRSSALP